jgi:L-threonylcarbamoyladenylate synthase
VLDLSGGVPRILRPGAVTAEMLGRLLPGVEGHGARDGEPMRSPGLLSKHYAPEAPLTLYEGSREPVIARLIGDARAALERAQRVGLVLLAEDLDDVRRALGPRASALHVRVLAAEQDPHGAAARLYASLRELDSAGVDTILARSFPAETGLGAAVRDRLRRAAAGRIVQI